MWQSLKNVYHLLVAVAANIRYGFPGRKLTVIGVTGTDGKTTTASLIYHILNSNKYPVSLISTVGASIHGKSFDTGFHVTNPAAFPLQKFLSQAVLQKDKYLVLEVTSHGIDQNRIWGIPFAVGVMTNVSHEHLDYHKTYDNYVRTKTRLLNKAKIAIVNADDISYLTVKKYLRNKNIHTYSLKSNDLLSVPSHFLGSYNAMNARAAYLACLELGLSKNQIEDALKTFTFPKGRGEIVYKKDFTVMVDFAHTPHSFEVLLPELRKKTKERLIHVFGSASQRDESKRPIMGKVASEYDDVIILTSEDPRQEDPYHIMDDIEKGMKKGKFEVLRIPDRKQAIEKAIEMSKKGDFVVATGKAHENSMNYGKGEESWNEFDVVKQALKKRKA